MQPHIKIAFDVGITFLASAVTLPLGFIITIILGRYLGAGDLGLNRMTSTLMESQCLLLQSTFQQQ